MKKGALDAGMVRDLVRRKIERLGTTQKTYAKLSGYSEQYLSDFLNGKCDPGPAILDAEGLIAVTHYVYRDP
jgi:transcriptional regulator with XRE-family HTH domain